MNNSASYLHDLSDNELVTLAQQGEKDAYSVLIGRYIFLVRNCASGYFSDQLDLDDIMQEGFIGLMNAVEAFDSGCEASFATFARLCINRNIISAVRRTLRKKQIPQSMLVFLDDDNSCVDSGSTKISGLKASNSDEPETAVINKENFSKLKSAIFSKLSKTEITVLQAYLSGMSYEQIARQTGVSLKSVDNAMQRLRKKLKPHQKSGGTE